MLDYVRCSKIKLKKVLGLTVCSNAALDVSQSTGVLAYPAGCTVVLFDSKRLTQSFLLNSSRKAITAVTYSQCGRYIATGECGINPTIKVWELNQQNGNYENGAAGTIVAEFPGHKYAVNCVAFSPNGKYLVSVGSQHDMIVSVYDWRQNLKIASNKVSAKVVAVSFSEDGSYFVTVGNRHVKYWYLDGGRKYKEPQAVPLMGRSAILGELRNNDFCAVACGKGERADSTYAITRNGQLVEFNSRRLLDKWVACITASANCICVSDKYILVGCAESIIRCFNADNLEYITTLPRTHYLGVDISQYVHIKHLMKAPPNAKYPDTIAIVFDEARAKVSCVYNDHSLYIWDLKDIHRVGKNHSFLYHSACIWGVETVPLNFLKSTAAASQQSNLPSECFFTCSSDDTIRVWGLDGCENTEVYRRNVYSKDLLRIMYIDEDLNFIKDMDNPILSEKSSSYDGRNGVRCIKINPDKTHLATGDRSGNIRIYNIANSKQITSIEAHDAEVLCLEYTNERIDRKLLASASRDRLIHVFDVLNGYCILQTLDDHSSSITSVRFIGSGLQFQMVSCGADKSIIFRNFQQNQFLRGNNCSGKTTLYDMEVDSNSKHILTACQDRSIRVYGTHNAKHTKTFKGSPSDEGSLIKLSLDMSGIYIATSCTDKTLSVYDYYSSECMARMYGHSELVTGLKFTNDCKHLISASGDGCVFIWQVPHDMIVTMQARLSQQAIRSGQQIPRPLAQPINDLIINTEPNHNQEKFGSPPSFMDGGGENSPLSPGFKFSEVGQLPQWAKKKATTEEVVTNNLSQQQILGTSPSQTSQILGKEKPKGRWAQRMTEPEDLRDIVEKSPAFNNNNSSDYNSSSSRDIIYNNQYLSEDSSIDSGMENRREHRFLSPKGYPKISEQKNMNSLNSESNTEHDGDVEDISDGERTSSDHGMIFYPAASPSTPTEFKVNEMDETELRKSIRRQKLEKQGLVLAPQSAPSTGTGSDDDDEGSTPSGDNAERSLASTLGGSSESIPQASSNSFTQMALDGVGLSERGGPGRKSISAMHNNDASKTISKSFTTTKKDELMKVINEAKQKLENGHIVANHKKEVRILKTIREVGYRSNLRTSQSISDISHSANMEMNFRGSSRPTLRQDMPQNHKNHYYLNCAAPKSVLTQNCYLIRQLQQDYPAYPSEIGLYGVALESPKHQPHHHQQHHHHHHQHRPNTLELPLKCDTSNPSPKHGGNSKRHPGILKNYKSCPVSPVHEELDWSTLAPSQASNISFANESGAVNKRHSMYGGEDSRSIFDMIHEDTEKMIAEIKSKYGDLDEYGPKEAEEEEEKEKERLPKIQVDKKIANKTIEKLKFTAQKDKNEHGFLSSEEDGNFSSDSLEDCSLNLEIQDKRKKVCKKHDKPKSSTLPKRSVSDYFIYEDFSMSTRKVSLSDILNETENTFLETQRHSSASFFLGQRDTNKSQESILSEEFSGGGSYFNSMESILSDESECKSAPLEVLFGRGVKTKDNLSRYAVNVEMSTSKSYGSSPNQPNYFDYYMQNEFSDSMNRSPTRLPTSITYPRLSMDRMVRPKMDDEFIPSLTMKNSQYGSSVSRSLSKEFAHQRHTNNSNPIFSCDGSEMFVKKDVSPPQNSQNFFAEIASSPPTQMRKSCSFEISLNDGGSKQKSIKRFEKNLEKFNRDHRTPNSRSHCGTLEMDYVPHKPPVAQRRTSSMRSKTKPKLKEKRNDSFFQLSSKRPTSSSDDIERTFDLYIAEKGISENETNLDSLDLYAAKKSALIEKENSVDSLDTIPAKFQDVPRSAFIDNLLLDSKLMSRAEYAKFRDIEKKIDVINKLVELEEQKLEHERVLKEHRMQPFSCDHSSAGYVKNLSRNFDKLARAAQIDLELERQRRHVCGTMKRNYSLPDVLEGAKMKSFEFGDKTICGSDKEHLNRTDDDDDDDEKDFEGIQSKSLLSAPDSDSSIRRACSLSDLSMGKGYKGSSSIMGGGGGASNHKPVPNARTNTPNRAQIKRTSSSSKLSSDSETDMTTRGGVMRPTISSQNKVNGSSSPVAPSRSYSNVKNSAGIINRRRGLQNAHSSVNLSTMGQDDSSSEEIPTPVAPSGKPIVPPRPRSISVDHNKRFSNQILANKMRANSSNLEVSPMDVPCKDTDVTNGDLTSHLCSNVITQLMQTAKSVMQLHQRLRDTEDANGTRNNNVMLQELETAVIMTQTMLTKITNSDPAHSSSPRHGGAGGAGSGGGGSGGGNSKGPMENGNYIQMMDECTDILSKVQKHVNN